VGRGRKRVGELCRVRASHTAVHHYLVVLADFFNWVIREGFGAESPMAKIEVARPKSRVVKPYTEEEIGCMAGVCDRDYEDNARFWGSRNKAIILVLVDSGVRLSELIGMTLEDVNASNGNMRVTGKGSKGRVVRIGKGAKKALWRYLMHRPDNGYKAVWLSEEKRRLSCGDFQCLVKRLKERAGIDGSGSVHRFGHALGLSFLRLDKNMFSLQYVLGHAQLEMVRYYIATLGMKDALKAHERAGPMDNMRL
jgi:site-specific recombinase XerD